MYEDLINKLRELPHLLFVQLSEHENVVYQAADAIEELQERVAASEATIKRQSDIIKAKDRDLQRMINVTSGINSPITNQDAMARLSAEEFYRKMRWLIFKYGCQFTNTELAVIEWLKHEVDT